MPQINFDKISFGKHVWQYRRKMGYSIRDLKSVTGVSIGTISKIENQLILPDVETLGTLCHCLDLDIREYFNFIV